MGENYVCVVVKILAIIGIVTPFLYLLIQFLKPLFKYNHSDELNKELDELENNLYIPSE